MAEHDNQVTHVRAEVLKQIPIWDRIWDCIEGQDRIKEKREAYLPKPNPTDRSEENAERYNQYLERAVFYGVSGRTLNGLTGQVFNKDPQIELPELLSLLEKDIDGSGVTLVQQAKRCLGRVLGVGRAGLLTDYPVTEGATTRAELLSGNIKPSIILYEANNIINWRVTRMGGRSELTLVVLKELHVEDDDGFEETEVVQYRELRLVEGVYFVQLWREVSNVKSAQVGTTQNTSEGFQMMEISVPVDSSGRPFDYIPFTFVGSENNDDLIDTPPLGDLCALNIAHYRNSADYEESSFITGQPTPFFAGLTEDWVKDVLGDKIQLGARAAVPLPVGGTAGMLQAEPNTMPKEAMELKERQMVALGAKLVEQKIVQRTATEASLENASETSVLGTAADNVSDAYTRSIIWAGAFVGVSEEGISVELNTDFDIHKMSAQERQILIQEWQGGGLDFEEYRLNLKKAGIAFKDDDEVRENIAAETGLGDTITEE